MGDPLTSLERLQAWYFWQCNGDWEHGAGIRISTMDNPGWSVTIELDGTDLEDVPYTEVRVDRSEEYWLQCWREGLNFKIYCGARNLDEALAIFLDWADVHTPPEDVARFSVGEMVRLHNGSVGVVRAVRRVASVRDAREHACDMGEALYLFEDAAGPIELAERFISPLEPRDS